MHGNETSRPRPLGIRPTLVIGACVLSVACVGQTQYEEVHSAAEVQSEAHRRAELEIAQLRQEIARLEAELRARENSISNKEDRLAQVDLDLEVANQKQAAKTLLVDRLRDELARAGDHLKAFSDEKEQLRQQLASMQERAAAVERAEREVSRVAVVVRDLSILEGTALGSGELELSAERGRIVLRTSAPSLFGPNGKKLERAGQRLAGSLGKLASLHEQVGFALGDTSSGGANVEGLRLLGEAIVAEGVASERISVEPIEPSSDHNAEADAVIRIDFSEPSRGVSEGEADLGGPAAG